MVITFGKYKGLTLDYVFKHDPTYIEWLAESNDSRLIVNYCNNLLNPISNDKIENIILESLMHRGYSESESRMFINKLKK